MPEHAPLTDDALAKLEFYNEHGVITGYDVKRVLADLREARRLLRVLVGAMERELDTRRCLPSSLRIINESRGYLATRKGAEHEE